MSDAVTMDGAMRDEIFPAGAVGAIAPLSSREKNPTEGLARRQFFAKAWSAVKGMAKAAFTKENAQSMAVGAATMFVLKSSAAAVAAAAALPAGAATVSVLGVGAAGAAGLSYYREHRAAKREGRQVDAFFSKSNLKRMGVAAGVSILGGATVAAYQDGLLAPVTEKLAALAKYLPVLPALHFNLSPISDAGAWDYSYPPPGGDVAHRFAEHAAAPAAAPAQHPSGIRPAAPAAATPAAPDATAAHAPASSPSHAPVAAKPAAPVVEKTAQVIEKPAPVVEKPAPVAAANAAPVPAGGGSALDRARELVAQQGGKPSRSVQFLLDRAASSAQAQKDLAVALLWGKDGLPVNPELARALLADAAKQGNRQAIESLAWMDKRGMGLPSSSVASGAAATPAPAAPATPASGPHVADAPQTKGVAHSAAAKPAPHAPVSHASAPHHAAAPVAESAPRTVMIAPDMPPVPVAEDGEAIACTILKGTERPVIDCAAPTGKDYILPGEKMTIEWPEKFPGIQIEFVNQGKVALQSWRWAAGVVYDDFVERVGSLEETFKKAAAWRAQHGVSATNVAENIRKLFPFAFNNG